MEKKLEGVAGERSGSWSPMVTSTTRGAGGCCLLVNFERGVPWILTVTTLARKCITKRFAYPPWEKVVFVYEACLQQ